MPEKLSYEDSCRFLQSLQLIDEGDAPPLPSQPPRHDDETLGVGFFGTQLADATLDNLTLPRTFFGRSEIRDVSFRGTDLSESTGNWNDFTNVDFGAADLSKCDLRGSVFDHVSFTGAQLGEADFRHSSFTDCDFTDADLAGVKITKEATTAIKLSPGQRSSIAWQSDDGDEPEGG